ncbi:hypothetical protein [Curtobacterium sp. Leaf261]|uniref:hypothetical protein n=1 Tax=Curtobacterium sp. Leaf261 TaxID=1736311 RepID=UPI000A676C6C|nr:hypothetical protein [Curtobacterium sp. Leaf261]
MSSFTTVVRSFRGQRAGRAVTLVLVVAGVAGVAVSGLPERADTSIEPTTQRDVDTWAMPLDGYVTPATELMDQAENLGQESCLADAGVSWDVPHRDPDALIVLSDSRNTPARGNAAPALASTRPLDASIAGTTAPRPTGRTRPRGSAGRSTRPGTRSTRTSPRSACPAPGRTSASGLPRAGPSRRRPRRPSG